MFDLNYISELLQALLLATLPVVAASVVRYFFAQYDVQRAKLSQENQYWLNFAAQIAVQAAEQVYKDTDGASKKRYALTVIQEQVDKSGLKIDVSAISAAIEAAVFTKDAVEAEPEAEG